MGKRILLIAGNFSPELTGIGKYNGEMVDWLINNGYECTVLATYPYYPQWNVQQEYKKNAKWFTTEIKNTNQGKKVNIIRCPHYIPANPSSLKRLISDSSIFITFGLAMLSLLFKRKHDFVISVAPPFTLGLLAVLYKKTKGAKFLNHIQDLQIEAARDLNMIKSRSIIHALFAIEKFILQHADIISTISVNMMMKMQSKCSKKVMFFPNWVDVEQFFPVQNKKGLKTAYGFSETDTIILYSGSIGQKQGLEQILHSAKYFQSKPSIKFVICGEGPYKTNLQKLSADLSLNNVHFLPLQPMECFNNFLNMADFHLVLQKANAGDLVLPSKLTTLLAIGGVSIVSASPGTSLYDIINNDKVGYIIKPEDQQSLNLVLEEAIGNDDNTKSYNAREYANNFLSINSILNTYANNALNSVPIINVYSSQKKAYENSSPLKNLEPM